MALVLTAPAQAATTLSSAPDPGAWVTDGPVYALVHGAGRTFIGGDFSHIGPRTGSGAPVESGGSVAGPFPEVAGGAVRAVAADGSGGWYIGGDFTDVGGVPRSHLAHITPAGAVDPNFDPAPDGTVRAIAVGSQGSDDGDVYIGGSFTHVGHPALTRQNVAAVSPAGTVLTWKPVIDGAVEALAEAYVPQKQVDGSSVDQPVIFVGGAFTNVGSQPAQPSNGRLAAIWGIGASSPVDVSDGANSGAVLAWNNGWSSGNVHAVAVQPAPTEPTDTTASVAVYAGGDSSDTFGLRGLGAVQFQIPLAPVGVNRAAPATPSSYSLFSFAAGCPAAATEPCAKTVRSLALNADALYVGGEFLQLGANDVARLGAVPTIVDPKSTSSLLNPAPDWNPGADGPVSTLAVNDGGTVYAAGDFATLAGAPRAGVGAVGPTAAATAWDPRPAGGGVDVLATSGSKVYVGGAFTSLGAKPVSNLAALDGSGAYDAGWPAKTDGGGVRALALSPGGGTLYVGGNFHAVNGGTGREHLAAFNAGSGSLLGWNPGADNGVLALVADATAVYAGGAFTHAGGAARDHIAALNAGDGTATNWNPGADGSVRAILPACGAIYIGGAFTHAAGQARSRAAALSATTGAALDWSPDVNTTVLTLAGGPNRIYAGGSFAFVDGSPRDGIAALDSATGTVLGWRPAADPAIVRALAVSPDGNTVYAGGSFLRMGGQARSRLAALDAASGLATAWNPGADQVQGDEVYALATAGGALFAGGSFRQVGSSMQQGFASFGSGSAGTSTPFACATPPPLKSGGSSDDDDDGDSGGGDSSTGTRLTTVASSTKTEPAPTAPQATADPQPKPLTIAHFELNPERFWAAPATVRRRHPARHYGTTFVFDVSRAVTVRIVISRELFGRRRGASCVAPRRSRRGARCTRYQRYGVIERAREAGLNQLRFSGHVSSGWLPPGVYTAKLIVAGEGTTEATEIARFQVLGRR